MANARKYGFYKPVKHYVNRHNKWTPKINKPSKREKKGNKT